MDSKLLKKDLELRGPGNFMGTQQSGEIPLKITNLIQDSGMIQKIKLLVEKIIEKDPKLANKNNAVLVKNLKRIINKNNKYMVWADGTVTTDKQKTIYFAKNLQVGLFDNLTYDFGGDPSLDAF